MNTNFKKSLIVAVVAGLSIAGISSAMAQSYLDGSAKARGDYGQMSRNQSRSIYQATAPTQQRSFSYEPSQSMNGSPKAETKKSDSAKPENKKPDSSPKPAQRDTQTNRSFSYEPGMSSGTTRSQSNSTPLYLVPKSMR